MFKPKQIVVANMTFTVSDDGLAGIGLRVVSPNPELVVFPIDRQAVARLREVADEAQRFFEQNPQHT